MPGSPGLAQPRLTFIEMALPMVVWIRLHQLPGKTVLHVFTVQPDGGCFSAEGPFSQIQKLANIEAFLHSGCPSESQPATQGLEAAQGVLGSPVPVKTGWGVGGWGLVEEEKEGRG